MRPPFLPLSVLVASTFGAATGVILFACDLFHSTQFDTLCTKNPNAASCSDGPLPDASATDFCNWEDTTAVDNAKRACAWLGACESPLGENAFGACMVRALAVYGCKSHPTGLEVSPGAPLHGYWDALWQARSCADVDHVVWASGRVQLCPEAGIFPLAACGSVIDGGVDNSATRVECDVPPTLPRAQNCAAIGQTCSNGSCIGSAGLCAPGCSKSMLHECDGPEGGPAVVDVGTDCSSVGAGQCATTGAGSSCVATGDTCDPSARPVCTDAGVVTACLGGFQATLDCGWILTSPFGCSPGPVTLVPSWDLTSACNLGDAGCSPGDSCSGNTLSSCAHGQTFATSCSGVGLGGCRMVQTVDGLRTACAPPTRGAP